MLVDTIGILSALRMRGLHDKPHLLAKLRICGSENYIALWTKPAYFRAKKKNYIHKTE